MCAKGTEGPRGGDQSPWEAMAFPPNHGSVEAATNLPEKRHRAARVIAANAQDADDLAELLEMLGFTTTKGRFAPAPIDAAPTVPAPRHASEAERDLAITLLSEVSQALGHGTWPSSEIAAESHGTYRAEEPGAQVRVELISGRLRFCLHHHASPQPGPGFERDWNQPAGSGT